MSTKGFWSLKTQLLFDYKKCFGFHTMTSKQGSEAEALWETGRQSKSLPALKSRKFVSNVYPWFGNTTTHTKHLLPGS